MKKQRRRRVTIFDELKAILGHPRPTRNEASHAGFILSRRARKR